jgi:hypothetical protein
MDVERRRAPHRSSAALRQEQVHASTMGAAAACVKARAGR